MTVVISNLNRKLTDCSVRSIMLANLSTDCKLSSVAVLVPVRVHQFQQ